VLLSLSLIFVVRFEAEAVHLSCLSGTLRGGISNVKGSDAKLVPDC
jgi:hypothetical protein